MEPSLDEAPDVMAHEQPVLASCCTGTERERPGRGARGEVAVRWSGTRTTRAVDQMLP